VSTSPRGSRPRPASSGGVGTLDYAELKRRIRERGLLERSAGRFALDAALALALLGVGVGAVALTPGLHWQIPGALALSLAFVHVAYLGHDLGHQRIIRSRRVEQAVCHLFPLVIGISHPWWVRKHNQHHGAPNRLGEDPDVDIPFVAFTASQLRRKSAFGRRLARHQALLLAPLLLFTAASLQTASVAFALRGRMRRPGLEAFLILGHFTWLLGLFLSVMDPLPALAAFALNQLAFGLHLGVVFATNHIGMPYLAEGDEVDFATAQVLTSRNVTGGPWLDRVFGGLNHQIEHHLFPTIPRHRLREARAVVKPYCEAHAVPYVETDLRSACRAVVRAMRRVAVEAEETAHG
jgi:fatty acid desaturase